MRSWHAGHLLGYCVGLQAGARAAEGDLERSWAATAARVRFLARTPTAAELAQRRRLDDGPCQQHCRRCSRCIRAGWLLRHGRDFAGVGR